MQGCLSRRCRNGCSGLLRASLLGFGSVWLLLAAPPTASAQGLRLAQLAISGKTGQHPRWRARTAATGESRAKEGRPPHRPRHRARLPRPALPPLGVPDVPGREIGMLPHRSERAPASQPQSVPRQVLLVIDQEQAGDLANEFARRHGLERKQSQPMALLNGRCELYELRANRSLLQVMAQLRRDPRLRLVQANFRYHTQDATGAPQSMLPQYALQKLALPQAHELARGRDVVIAVIDAAIDASHPDLKGAISLAFDAVGAPDKGSAFHGTAVAGIIRAQGALAGAAPQATILAARAFHQRSAGEAAQTTSWTLLRALEWAVSNKANVLNLSFAGPKDEALHVALQAAMARGVIAVAAAGNNGPKAAPAYPAAYPEVIAVTAVDANDQRYAQANRGSYIAIAAPGVDVLAPVENGKHSFLSGTSFATAYVSGIVALLLERNRNLDTAAVIDLIAAGAEDLGPQGRDDDFGAGRVNAFASLKAMERQRSDKER